MYKKIIAITLALFAGLSCYAKTAAEITAEIKAVSTANPSAPREAFTAVIDANAADVKTILDAQKSNPAFIAQALPKAAKPAITEAQAAAYAATQAIFQRAAFCRPDLLEGWSDLALIATLNGEYWKRKEIEDPTAYSSFKSGGFKIDGQEVSDKLKFLSAQYAKDSEYLWNCAIGNVLAEAGGASALGLYVDFLNSQGETREPAAIKDKLATCEILFAKYYLSAVDTNTQLQKLQTKIERLSQLYLNLAVEKGKYK